MKENIIMLTDSYKFSHFLQYPGNMVKMFDYAEARSDKVYPRTVFFGLQYLIKRYLSSPITKEDIKEAQTFAEQHGVKYNLGGWKHILKKHGGYLPVKIRAVREGTLVPTRNVLFTIESTDPVVPWVVGYLETLLLKVWYTSNIATRSYYVRQLIQDYWFDTVDEEDQFGINFAFHNFSDRGCSSVESAALSGISHLTQFMGTDNFNSLQYAKEYYDEDDAGFSISASEHSSISSWGRENELDMIDNMLETFKDDVMACVCDTYNYYETVDQVTKGRFKEKIESDYPKFIIRPDSGDQIEVLSKTLDIMEKNKVKYKVNKKGYKEFLKYGIIWGDSVDQDSIKQMLELFKTRGYSASCISFGSGGWLAGMNRDSQGWAMKCSSITVDEGSPIENSDGTMTWESYEVKRDVYKGPITDHGKVSKKGEITLWYNHASGEYFTDKIDFETNDFPLTDMLNTVYENGKIYKEITLTGVRNTSRGPDAI